MGLPAVRRLLGNTQIAVSPVAMGCWPISGMTSRGVTEADSLATLAAAFEAGINFFDTAYCYGADGESERLVGRALGHRRHEIVIATKGGLHWRDGQMVKDASPARLRLECEESLRRLGTDRVELLYLHAPDPATPIGESAAALRQLQAEGKALAIGASNCSLAQLQEFHAVCPLSAHQPAYNMLQREIESEVIPWCEAHGISTIAYWPLLKGLLAGGLHRDHQFALGDGRPKYPMFQGVEWQRNMDLVDRLRQIAAGVSLHGVGTCTVAQLVVNWTIHRPGITAALCGAKRPEQIRETASAMGWQISAAACDQIDAALAERGTPVSQTAVR